MRSSLAVQPLYTSFYHLKSVSNLTRRPIYTTNNGMLSRMKKNVVFSNSFSYLDHLIIYSYYTPKSLIYDKNSPQPL